MCESVPTARGADLGADLVLAALSSAWFRASRQPPSTGRRPPKRRKQTIKFGSTSNPRPKSDPFGSESFFPVHSTIGCRYLYNIDRRPFEHANAESHGYY